MTNKQGYRRGPSSRFFEAAESTQSLSRIPVLGSVYDLGRKAVAGSGSLQFFEADWVTTSDIVLPGRGAGWHRSEPNPSLTLRFVPRTWNRVTVYGVSPSALSSLDAEIQAQYPNLELQSAVTFLADDEVAHVAPLPQGFGTIHKAQEGHKGWYAASLREGVGPTYGSLGRWSEALGRLWLIGGAWIIEQHVHERYMARLYPEVPTA